MIVVVQGTRPSRPPSAAFRLQAGGETRFHACGLLRWDGGAWIASVPGRLELTPSTPGTRFHAAQGMCEGEATLLAQSGSPSGTLWQKRKQAGGFADLARAETAGGFADLGRANKRQYETAGGFGRIGRARISRRLRRPGKQRTNQYIHVGGNSDGYPA